MMQLGDLCVAELFCKKVPRNISEVSQELPLYKIVLASPSDFGSITSMPLSCQWAELSGWLMAGGWQLVMIVVLGW